MDSIIYEERPNDNTKDVISFIGDHFYVCEQCGGSGEYEDEFGLVGCQLCNSRLIPFLDKYGKVQTADWGDEIIKDENGQLILKRNYRYD